MNENFPQVLSDSSKRSQQQLFTLTNVSNQHSDTSTKKKKKITMTNLKKKSVHSIHSIHRSGKTCISKVRSPEQYYNTTEFLGMHVQKSTKRTLFFWCVFRS